MKMDSQNVGFSKMRTVRVFGIGLVFLGIIFVSLGFVLNYADDFASQVVNLAMARYSNFTGKFALNNFAEDQQLMKILLSVKDDLLPFIQGTKPFVFFAGILFSLAGIFALIFPQPSSLGLLKLRILHLENEDAKPFHFSRKTLCILAGIFALLFIVFGIVKCSDPSRKTPEKIAELEREASQIEKLQREYFGRKKSLGTWEQIGYAPAESEYFLFEKRGKFAWQARNREKWESCPDSSIWKVSFEITGFFSKELKVYKSSPKNCVKIRTEK
ncbi:MAG: hypothetical protein SOZ02_09780 [Hallerella porci]|uniref:hypothetical protein n=1 Tax=Hallerella porci TaxID=1945871 RepID=UPI002A824925|nr:hypothetical protein [Hallerella porci]MDY3922431.1 hypothetical protein [Hallerella porci]